MKDGPELAFVGEKVGLVGQEGPAGIHERDNRQAVFPGDLLCPDMFAAGDPEIGAAFHCSIVGDDHALAAFDHSDTGDDAGAGRNTLVHVQSGQLAEFQKGGARIDQPFDPFAGQDLAFFHMTFARHFGAADAL